MNIFEKKKIKAKKKIPKFYKNFSKFQLKTIQTTRFVLFYHTKKINQANHFEIKFQSCIILIELLLFLPFYIFFIFNTHFTLHFTFYVECKSFLYTFETRKVRANRKYDTFWFFIFHQFWSPSPFKMISTYSSFILGENLKTNVWYATFCHIFKKKYERKTHGRSRRAFSFSWRCLW